MKYSKQSQAFFLVVLWLAGLTAYAVHCAHHKVDAAKPAALQGERAMERLKQAGAYDSLQAAVSAARYRIYADEKTPNAFYANNSAQQLSANFARDAARLTVKHGANSDGPTSEVTGRTPAQSEQSQISLRFIGAGYGDSIHFAQEEPSIKTAENRLSYTHKLTTKHDSASGWLSLFAKSAIRNSQSAIEEWYVNTPEGIEHGFTISEPVDERVEGELLKVEIELDGDFLAQAVEDGKRVVFKSKDGNAQVSYAGLKAYDAEGKELAARISVSEAVLSFEVDDADAIYPITIDPTFTQQQKLVPGSTATDSFGRDVAINGNTAVIGVPLDDVGASQNQGSVFVFVRSGTTWSQQARLFASDGAANDRFGGSVAISANTIVVGAPDDDIGANQDQGSAYVFVRSGTTWTQQAKLMVINTFILGRDVTIDGDYAALGEFNEVQIFHRAGTSWTNESSVSSSSGGFGASVSLSGDTLIVGAQDLTVCFPPPVDDCFTYGAAYIYVRSGTVWNNQKSIFGISESAGIGGSVSISGNTAVIGARIKSATSTTNRVEIWFRSGTDWTQQSVIGGQPNENIGKAVTIDGDTVVYTAPGGSKVLLRAGTTWTQQATLTSVGDKVALSGNTLLTGSPGYAKVDVRTGTTWAEQAELTAQEGATGDQFGYSVAIDRDTAVVGVPFKDVGTASNRGAAFVFKRTGTIWQQEAQLAASDGAGGNQFGYSVAVEGDTVAVSAPFNNTIRGAAYIFTRSGSSWTQRLKITAADGQAVDLFGYSIALSGNTLVIGSPLNDNVATGGDNNGSAYVFTGSGATWTLEAKLNAMEEADGDQFGTGVDINGETIAVGARFVDNGGNTQQGAAYVFTRTGTSWTEQARLLASDGATDDNFGQSLSVSGDRVAIGSPFHNVGANSNQGAVYLFNRSGSAWTESQILMANDGATDDTFGISVALQSDALLVGASGDDFASTNAQGSAYVFIPFGSTWTQTQKLFAVDGATNDGYGNAVALNDRTFLIGASNDDFGSTVDQGSAFAYVPSGPSVWTGANSANWSAGGNWDSSVAPNVFDDVVLPASGVTNEAVLNINANIHSLTIDAGRSLTINAGRTLTINGDLTLNGTIVGGGTLVFNGANFLNNNSANVANVRFGVGVKQLSGSGSFFGNTVTVLSGSTLQLNSNHTMNRLVVNNGGTLNISSTSTLLLLGSGVAFSNNGSVTATGTVSFDGISAQSTSGNITFQNLTINNAAGVTLGADATVNVFLALTSGDLNTGAFALTMPATATSSGASDVVGNVKRTGFAAGACPLPPCANTLSFGNPNNQITITSGTPPTDITVNLIKQAPSDFANATRRAYTITPNSGSGFAAALRLHYQDSELNGNSEATLGLWRKGGSWTNLGATRRNATDNWVELAGIAQFSPWVISGPAAPTAVEFAGATATQFDNGTLIEWQTGFEVSNLGFNLYREENGKRTLVNPLLIAGSALVAGSSTVMMTSGKTYAWFDKSPPSQNALYWLEDVDTNGHSTWHGPVYVAKSFGILPEYKVQQAKLLSSLGTTTQQPAGAPVEATALQSRATQASLSLQTDIAAHDAVNLEIKHEGWYRVAREELLAAGLAKDASPRHLQLFVDGVEQPIIVEDEDSGQEDGFAAIEFYGLTSDSPYSDTRIYWLVAGNQPGLRIPVINTKPNTKGAESFPFTVERKERSIYFSALLNGDAENWFGAVVTPQGVEQPITIRSLDEAAQDKAQLEIALQGVTSLVAGPDHQVEVRLNNQFIGHLLFDGRQHTVERFAAGLATLKEGENLITLTSGSPADISLVDTIRLTYPRKYTAQADVLKWTTAAGFTAQRIDRFTSDQIRVFDVTEATSVRELTGVIESSGNANFAIAVDAQRPNRTLLTLTTSQFKRPESISANHPSSLRNQENRADFVIITRREWADALEPLKALRQKHGLTTMLVDIEDIYDEFSFGEKTPYAVRDFLRYATLNWSLKPRFVLLAGDASHDPRNYTGLGQTDFVPTKLTETAFLETASDDWLTDFNNDALGELAIGRLPISSELEASAMVNKLLRDEMAAPPAEITLFADLNDGFDFEQVTLQLRALLPSSVRVQEIFRSRNDDATTKALLLDALHRAQRVVNYAGHGSVTNWRGDMLTTDDARALTNSNRLPLLVMMNCLNGYFQDPLRESLAEALMRNEQGGAVAVWASSGMTFPNAQASINQQLYRTLFGKTNLTLGEHIRFAKLATSDSDVRQSWILFGDPTMKLK